MRVLLLPVLVLLLILPGCTGMTGSDQGQGLTPRQQLAVAEQTFTTSVQQLTVARQAGRIDGPTWERIKGYFDEGDRALDQAWATVDQPGSSMWLTSLQLLNSISTQLALEKAKVTP